MNKKAFFMGLYLDMWGWFIFLIGMIAWFIIALTVLPESGSTISSQNANQVIFDHEFRLYLLTSTDSGNILDLVVNKYQFDNDGDKLITALNTILNPRFGIDRKVCWRLSSVPDSNIIANVKCGDELKNLFESITTIPLHLGKENKVKIKLEVLGYV
jgi:hypothetical protein